MGNVKLYFEHLLNFCSSADLKEIDLNMEGLKDTVVEMLGGKRCRIDTGTFQNDLTSLSSRDDIFTLLVHLGYLAYDFVNREVFIPNEEVRGEFVRAVKGSRRTAFNWIELQCKERKAYLQDRAV